MSHAHALRRPMTIVVALLVAVVAVCLVLTQAPAARAHDVLVDNMPGDHEVLAEAPEEIVLTFNNAVLDMGAEATVVRVTDAVGNELDTGVPAVQNRNVITKLDEVPDGAYRVIWRVVSSDGHPIQGTFAFAVGPDGEAALEALPAVGEAPAQDEATDGDDEAVALPVIIGIAVVVVVLVGAAIFVLMRRRATS